MAKATAKSWVLLAAAVLAAAALVHADLIIPTSGPTTSEPATIPPPSATATATGPTATAAAPTPPISPRGEAEYVCRRAAGAVTIDREDHPEEWRNAAVIRNFKVPGKDAAPRKRTELQLLWDDANLYARFVASDDDIKGKYTKRTDPLWEDDAVELFFKPYADKPTYYEFEVNPLNTVMALSITPPRKTLEEESNWDAAVKSAVAVEGSLNDPKDTDKLWRVTLAIPWKNLALIGGKPPKAGDDWKFAGCRVDQGTRNKEELSSNAPFKVASFHRTGDWATLKFAE